MLWLQITACISVINVVISQVVWDVDKQNQFVRIIDYCPYFPGCKIGFHVQCIRNPNMVRPEEYDPACGKLVNGHYQEMTPPIADRLLAAFNAIRSKVALGNEHGFDSNNQTEAFPRGYGMYRLQWDPELATHAQAWTRQCKTNRERINATAMCFASKKFSDPGVIWDFVEISDFPNPKSLYEQHTTLKARIIGSLFSMVKKWYLNKNLVKEIKKMPLIFKPKTIENWPEVTRYYNIILGKATHVGCGFSVHRELPSMLFTNDQKLRHVYVVELACNFSERVGGALRTNLFLPSKPTGPGISEKCGCPLNSIEGPDCLCSVPNSNDCLESTCNKHLVLLPIITVEDVVYDPKLNEDNRRSQVSPKSDKQMQSLVDLAPEQDSLPQKEALNFHRLTNNNILSKRREMKVKDSAYWGPIRRKQDINNQYFSNQPIQQTIGPAQNLIASLQKLVENVEQPVEAVERSAVPVQELVGTAQQSNRTLQPLVASVQQTVVPVQQTVVPVQQSGASVKQLVVTAQQSTVPVQITKREFGSSKTSKNTEYISTNYLGRITNNKTTPLYTKNDIEKGEIAANYEELLRLLQENLFKHTLTPLNKSPDVDGKAYATDLTSKSKTNQYIIISSPKMSNVTSSFDKLNLRVTKEENAKNAPKQMLQTNSDIEIDFSHILEAFGKNYTSEDNDHSENALLQKIRPLIVSPYKHLYNDPKEEEIDETFDNGDKSNKGSRKINEEINKLLDFRHEFLNHRTTSNGTSRTRTAYYSTEKSLLSVGLRQNIPLDIEDNSGNPLQPIKDILNRRHKTRTLSEEEFFNQQRRYHESLKLKNHKRYHGSPHMRKTQFRVHSFETDSKILEQVSPVHRKLKETFTAPIFMRDSSMFLSLNNH